MSRQRRQEVYYAKNNHPNFYQFPSEYDFRDAEDREYLIARENKRIFQNSRASLQVATRQPRITSNLPVVRNNYGYTKLFVRLPSADVSWFLRSEMNKPLRLTNTHTLEEVDVVLKIDEKSNPKLRTGAIWVANLETL